MNLNIPDDDQQYYVAPRLNRDLNLGPLSELEKWMLQIVRQELGVPSLDIRNNDNLLQPEKWVKSVANSKRRVLSIQPSKKSIIDERVIDRYDGGNHYRQYQVVTSKPERRDEGFICQIALKLEKDRHVENSDAKKIILHHHLMIMMMTMIMPMIDVRDVDQGGHLLLKIAKRKGTEEIGIVQIQAQVMKLFKRKTWDERIISGLNQRSLTEEEAGRHSCFNFKTVPSIINGLTLTKRLIFNGQ